MSRSNLQKEKFVSTRVAAGKRAGTSEKMKPSISNSFIKKQSAQIKTMSQGKGHNFTMGNNHDSSSSKPNRGNSRIVRRTISSKEGRSQPCRNSQWKVSHTKNKQDSSTRNDATQILDRDHNNFSDDEPYSRTIKDGKIEYNNQIRNDKSKITPKLAKISKVISSSQKRTREGEMSPGNQKIAPLMNHSSAYKRRSTHSSQAKKTSDTKEVESNKAKEKDLKPKTSDPDNILNSIIQSRCLTKDQQRAAVENDKMSP